MHAAPENKSKNKQRSQLKFNFIYRGDKIYRHCRRRCRRIGLAAMTTTTTFLLLPWTLPTMTSRLTNTFARNATAASQRPNYNVPQ